MPRAWYNALLPGLTPLLDTISSLPCGVAETLPEWADKQAASKRRAEGWASVVEPATKCHRVELRKETAEPGSVLAAKRKEYAALMESAECARLDMVMAQERARLAREQAEAEAAIAADTRAVQPTQTATATTDTPCMLNLQATSAIPTLPAAEAMRNHDICAKSGAQQWQGLDTGGRKLFRGNSVATIWSEWQYGGEYASVKSLLRESKSSGKLTWRGSRKGAAKQSERSELSKKQHLPQAIHALIKQGLPEQEAVRQVDELLLRFGITTIRAKFDAFLWRQQMKSPKKGVELLSQSAVPVLVRILHLCFAREPDLADELIGSVADITCLVC